jgi:tRNA modification GTPase
MIDQKTICAISTSPGMGAIAVVRLSGEVAITIVDQVFKSVKEGKKLADQKANTVHFGSLISGETVIDEVVVAIFKAPHSFTGEDTVEISCHGSVFIQQSILQLLIEHGARLALPGEYTQRAFLNGKMDLSQAEAVADLISSSSSAAHSLAMKQMKGGISNEISHLRNELLTFTSLIELELDFSEEDVEFVDRDSLFQLVESIDLIINNLANSFQYGNAIKNGIPVAIVGDTNVGKSTLLNILLKEERAIVSDIAGTTRDVIEDVITFDGIQFRFIDTAGIRSTTDTIENLGIERSFEKIKQAHIVLVLFDSSSQTSEIELFISTIKEQIAGKNAVLIFNKIDKIDIPKIEELERLSALFGITSISISAKKHVNIDLLVKYLIDSVNRKRFAEEDVVITNMRHYEALINANQAIDRVLIGLKQHISADFLSQDIRECLYYLGSITGEISNDEVLGNIFKNFCIGK